MKRLLVVYNQRSSNFCHVQREVIDKLPGLDGYIIGKYSIKKTNFDDNVATLSELLQDGDTVLVAGGDATAAIAANAILKSGKDASISALAYGNFNDFARTISKTFQRRGISERGSGRVTRKEDGPAGDERPAGDASGAVGAAPAGDAAGGTPAARSGASTVGETAAAGPAGGDTPHYYPLTIFIDGQLWRYSTCYVSIGMMAEATKIFDEPKIRKNLQKGHRRPWRSYFHLAAWYFRNRHKNFIPSFTLNGHPQPKNVSDYFAVNGASAAGIMKGGEDYQNPKIFTSGTYRLGSPFRLFSFMTKSIFRHVPGQKTEQDTIEFATPSTITIQAEGEYKTFKNIRTIKIQKSSKKLKISKQNHIKII